MTVKEVLSVPSRHLEASIHAIEAAGRSLLGADTGIVGTIRAAAARADITVQPLRGGISILSGSGGNIAVLAGREGKLVVDAGLPVSRARIEQVLDRLGPAPIRHLINTHWHFDHTDGNEWMHSAGATVCAHRNTWKHLSTATRVEGWRYTFPAAPTGGLPTVIIDADCVLRFNDRAIAIRYHANAHTDSDLSVHFTDADVDVLLTGDAWWNGVYPFIDYSTGGNIDGAIRAAQSLLASATESTIIVPGHGPVGNKQALMEYCDMLIAMRDRIAAWKREGRSLEEIVAGKPGAPYDAKWGNFVIRPPDFVELVYQGV
jgi:glyoxylase-like metal-dependent hydrolase (beta-lactamase superfamily II)